MSKIGAQQGEFAVARSKGGSDLLSIGSKARFDSSLKRQSTHDDNQSGFTAHQPIGLGTAPKDSISGPPPTYDTDQSVGFEDIDVLIRQGSGKEVETFKALSTGIPAEDLPNIIIVGSAHETGNVAIATVATNILIPSAIYSQWVDAEVPDAQSIDQFNQAFLSFLSRGYQG